MKNITRSNNLSVVWLLPLRISLESYCEWHHILAPKCLKKMFTFILWYDSKTGLHRLLELDNHGNPWPHDFLFLPRRKDFPVRIAPATEIQHTGRSPILSKRLGQNYFNINLTQFDVCLVEVLQIWYKDFFWYKVPKNVTFNQIIHII